MCFQSCQIFDVPAFCFFLAEIQEAMFYNQNINTNQVHKWSSIFFYSPAALTVKTR